MKQLLRATENGLYCEAGDFYIDPWRPVSYAVTTHAHSDHARSGSQYYLSSEPGRGVLQERLGPEARIETLPWNERVTRNGVTVSLHPAGHILGSAQVRVECRGEVWVVSGDYKVEPESTCTPFEPVKCHTFITESTFGLPIYRWRPQQEIFAGLNAWWRHNQSCGRATVVFAYPLGKSQRILSGIDASIGPVVVHGAVARLLPHYQAAGIPLPEVFRAEPALPKEDIARCLAVAPPSAGGTPWLRRFGDPATAFASGWMQVRGARRWQALDRGFVLSDHVDWPGLLASIRATGAERVMVTHGFTQQVVRWLRENGWEADVLPTRYTGEAEDAEPSAEPEPLPATG